ncbi:MAG TPA: hypothetical protein VN845_09960 [Solirubrobacteraceae bacterium]|nr:hypothetical protein [Solirubrobacteraceae bacterium]
MEVDRPHSTVHKVLRRGGCSRREPSERPAVVGYEWLCPGNLLHMDVKKIVKFQEPGYALTGDPTKRSRKVGWEYVHSIVDACSRLAYSEIHDDEKAPTVTAFTRLVLDWFLEHGIVAERLTGDNAFTCVHNKTLRELLYCGAIRHLRTRPYTPRTNGKVERYQQTCNASVPIPCNTPQAMPATHCCHTGFATTTRSAPTALSATAHPSHAFEMSPGTTPRARDADLATKGQHKASLRFSRCSLGDSCAQHLAASTDRWSSTSLVLSYERCDVSLGGDASYESLLGKAGRYVHLMVIDVLASDCLSGYHRRHVPDL